MKHLKIKDKNKKAVTEALPVIRDWLKIIMPTYMRCTTEQKEYLKQHNDILRYIMEGVE